MKNCFFACLLMLFILISPLYSAKIEVFTADNIIQLIKDKIVKVQTFSGSFIYSINNKVSWGAIKYKAPNKFVLSFLSKGSGGGSYETGQKIISDGKNLWLVFKNENIAINETLDKSKDTPMIGWNITRLLKEYVPTLPKTGYKVQYTDKPAFKLTFIPKSNTSGFKYINMIINEGGDILKIETVNQLGISIELSIRYDSFNDTVQEKNFEYEPDENTQIYENIILPKDDRIGND